MCIQKDNAVSPTKGDFFMKDSIQPITIQQFEPNTIVDSVGKATLKSGILPLRDRRVMNLIRSAQTQPPEYFIKPEGQKMVEDVSQLAYQRLNDFLGFCCREDNRSETAYSAYNNYMRIANEAVHGLIGELAPDQRSRFSPKNPIDFIPEPGEIIKLLSMPEKEIDNTFRFEIARQVLLGLTAAKLEAQTYDLRKKLNEVQLLVDTKIFNHGQPLGRGTITTIDYFTRPETNEVVSVSSVPSSNMPPQELVKKTTTIGMRTIPGEIGLVHTDPRFKPDGSAVNKSLREALSEKAKGNDGTINANTLTDAAGMRFIVANEFSSDGKNVTALMNLFRETLQEHYGDAVSFEEQQNNKGKPNQSDKFRARKLYIKFSDGITLEVMFVGIGDHLNNENRVGRPHPQTGLYDGQAHPLYSVNRNSNLLPLYLPKEIYGEYSEKDLLTQAHQRIARELLERDRASFDYTRRITG